MLLSMKCVIFQSVEANEEDGSLHPVMEYTVYCRAAIRCSLSALLFRCTGVETLRLH